jgi:NADPH-dependent 2,4-dienoyl-CoA reductase/sulfur reductase-like enzyme
VLEHVVVVGASLAGWRAVETLRNDGFEGRITLIGSEPHLPYDRPPLSKKLLSGEWSTERVALRREDELGRVEVDLRLGVSAERLDPVERRVHLDDGTSVAYDGVILATGSTVRRLPDQPDLPGVFTLRTLDDSLALRDAIADGSPRVVVIGAGFIGSEVAATARVVGRDVAIVEVLPVPLARALGAEMGAALAELHRDGGVELRLGVGVAAFEGDGRIERLRLTDNSVLDADVVVVGVGVAPATGWLSTSGLELRDGIVCDATLAAGPPGVFAAGDVTRWPNELFHEEMRVEHWTNAAEQGALAARNLLAAASGGRPSAYTPVPFFWSDQYAARIQFLGRAAPDDEVRVVSGSVAERGFVALYGRAGRLRGVLGLSRPRQVMGYQRLLAAGVTWEDALAHASATG